MPTRTHTDPFSPRAPLTREQLQRYARGELSPAEQREVELHAEHDPLVREAMAGLALPGAIPALQGLSEPPGISAPGWGTWVIGGTGAVVIVGCILWYASGSWATSTTGTKPTTSPKTIPEETIAKRTDSLLNAVRVEIAATTPLALEVRASVSHDDRFIQRDTIGVEPLPVRPLGLPHVLGSPAQQLQSDAPPAHHLLYLHNFKLVDPKDLYGEGAPKFYSLGVPANGTASEQEVHVDTMPQRPPANIPYLDYMDDALAAYARGEQHLALNDMLFLLGQYPDDVNGQFYAGLCCYDLGMFIRARSWFDQVKQNKMDEFNEEADWYEALAVERMDGGVAAHDRFDRIAKTGGFYAAKAQEHLK